MLKILLQRQYHLLFEQKTCKDNHNNLNFIKEKLIPEFNQNKENKQSLPEIRCEVYCDSMFDAYIYILINQLQSVTHNNGIKEEFNYSYSKSLQQSSDSQDYKDISVFEVQKTNYRGRKYMRTGDEHSNFKRN